MASEAPVHTPRLGRAGGAYDAFISYSHKPDTELATQLQAGVQRYARRWNQVRALRVFRRGGRKAGRPAHQEMQ